MNLDDNAICFIGKDELYQFVDIVAESYSWQEFAVMADKNGYDYVAYVVGKLEGTVYDKKHEEFDEEIIESFFSKRFNNFYHDCWAD